MKYQIVSERTSKYQFKISSPSDIYPVLKKYHNKKQEHFLVLTLDGSHQVIRVNIATIGILNRAIIHPREVFIPAIKDNACSIVIAHNHPSGTLEPSKEDRDITYRLIEAGKLLGIEVLDHVIISKKGYYSFLEEGEM